MGEKFKTNIQMMNYILHNVTLYYIKLQILLCQVIHINNTAQITE